MIVGTRAMAQPIGEFGTWLSDRLDELSITQFELAGMLRISPATVSNHIRRRSRPQILYLISYSVVLNADYNDLKEMVERDWA